jgi:hypothetical protein
VARLVSAHHALRDGARLVADGESVVGGKSAGPAAGGRGCSRGMPASRAFLQTAADPVAFAVGQVAASEPQSLLEADRSLARAWHPREPLIRTEAVGVIGPFLLGAQFRASGKGQDWS